MIEDLGFKIEVDDEQPVSMELTLQPLIIHPVAPPLSQAAPCRAQQAESQPPVPLQALTRGSDNMSIEPVI